MKLILFDIDGTILHVDRAVTLGLTDSLMRNVLGSDQPLDGFDLHGKTDRQIMRELNDLAGMGGEGFEERTRAMEMAIIEHWSSHLRPGTVTILPGVRPLLERLHAADDVALGLLTGNLEVAAHLKLQVHGLDHFFSFGAFGSDAELRSDLAELALRRAADAYGREFDREATLIIGDSHRDIACARSAGVVVLAVATGNLTPEQLADYHPDAVCDTLLDCSFLQHFLNHT